MHKILELNRRIFTLKPLPHVRGLKQRLFIYSVQVVGSESKLKKALESTNNVAHATLVCQVNVSQGATDDHWNL